MRTMSIYRRIGGKSKQNRTGPVLKLKFFSTPFYFSSFFYFSRHDTAKRILIVRYYRKLLMKESKKRRESIKEASLKKMEKSKMNIIGDLLLLEVSLKQNRTLKSVYQHSWEVAVRSPKDEPLRTTVPVPVMV